MAERRPLVVIGGQVQELPNGDTVPGTSGEGNTVTRLPVITSSQNLTNTHFEGNVILSVDTTSGAITLTIPDTITNTQPLTIKHRGGSNTLTIAVSGGNTLESKNSLVNIPNNGVVSIDPEGSGLYFMFGDLE